MSVEAGDIVYIGANEHGWAHATRLSDGQKGWVPSYLFSNSPRYAHSATQFYAGWPDLNFCNVAVGDQIHVYHRETDESDQVWAYGSVACQESPTASEGWFPGYVLLLA